MTEAGGIGNRSSRAVRGQRGTATVELAIVLPLLLIILFVIVDIGRLIDARLAVAKLAQQGGLMGSRDLPTVITPIEAPDLITLIQKSAGSLDLVNNGRIYVWKINGSTSAATNPTIDTTKSGRSAGYGALSANSTIGTGFTNLGLPTALYTSMDFNSTLGMADIPEVTVVEIFYRYRPVTPLSRLLPGLLTGSEGGFVISSKAIFP